MMARTKKSLSIAAVGLACALFSQQAQANTITLAYVSTTGAGPFTFNYSAIFDNSTIKSGDFFTIQDFGVVISSVTPVTGAGTWTMTQALLGPTAPLVTPAIPDSPTVLNVTFTYSGPDTSLTLFTSSFSLTTATDGIEFYSYTSQEHQT